MTLMRRLQA